MARSAVDRPRFALQYHRGVCAARLPHHATRLREVDRRDVPVLFQYQLDPESNRMAGTKPRSAEEFEAVWEGVMKDPAATARVILRNDAVVGSISCFEQDGRPAVGYWIGREHWGQGIATEALALFLDEVSIRPLHATVVRTNVASTRILEKCGFRLSGHRMGEETDRYVGCELATFVLD